MDESHNTPHETKQRYIKALAAFQQKDFAVAAQLFSKGISKDHLCGMLCQYYAGESYLQLGLQQMRQQDFSEAVRSLSLAAQHNTHPGTQAKYLACCFAQLRRFDQASEQSDRESSLQPEKSDSRVRLALSLWQDGQQDAAIQMLHDGLSDQREQVEWHFQLGVLQAAREAYEEAIEAFEAALALRPDHTEAMVHLALCHGTQQNPAEAVRHLLRAQQQRPNDVRIGLFLAMALAAVSESQTTPPLQLAVPTAPPALDIADVEELTHIVAHEPDVVDAFVALPEVDAEHNVFELLSAVLDRAVMRQPGRAELYYHQARIYNRLGHRDLAIASCERAIEINPKLVQALITLANLYRDTDRQQDAAVRLQQVVEMGFEYADVYYLLGCIYRDQGHSERARDSYHKALQINARYQAAREALDALAA